MKTTAYKKSQQGGAITLFYLILMLSIIAMIGAVMTSVAGSVNLQHRRSDLVAAQQFAQGGAVIGCDELNRSFTTSGALATNLGTKGYVLDAALSDTQTNVYRRTISAPFTNQTVAVQLLIPKTSSPKTAQIVASAKTGKVTQSATVNVKLTWGWPAAIISTNAGTNDTGISASVAKAGNVAIDGASSGPIIVDGGQGPAILANGSANVDYSYATVSKTAVSAGNYGSSNEIPDYTAQGTANALFDFQRFIAAADSTSNSISESGTNHFTSLASFLKANAKAAATPAKALEGIIVVDIVDTKDAGIAVLANPASYLGTQYLPAANPEKYGITVKGTLFFNFGSAFGPLDKIFNRMPMNINPADLSGLKAGDPTTYPSGYPATYTDPSKNPVNLNLASKGFMNFTSDEDLPALMYSIGTVDMHGPVNISGVVYTPSYSEIEDKPNEGFKVANQTQYIRGSVIVGMGIYFQNQQVATSIISYDANALDSLATVGSAGKKLKVAYWQ